MREKLFSQGMAMSWELFHYEIAITSYCSQACAVKKPARAALDENAI